jgi:WD40 repeat protein
VAFSPDGKILASAGDDQTVILWDVASGKELATLEGHSDWISDVTFSPDSKLMATASEDKTVKLWNVPVFGK